MNPSSHLDRHVNVTGGGDHTIKDIPIARFCAVSRSQHGNVLCIYHKYAGGRIQERTIHSKIQLADYGNKVDDNTMKLGGQQTIVAHGGHIFPLSMNNGLCYLEQRIPTDEEMHFLPQVIMTSDQVWDPSIYDDRISLSEHIKHLPSIPTGENEELYDIEGNLDIESSFSTSQSVPQPDVLLVETIDIDEFEGQHDGLISKVSDKTDIDIQSKDTIVNSTSDFVFIPVQASPAVHFEHPDPNVDDFAEPEPSSTSTDTYIPGRHPIPVTAPKQ